MRRLVLHPWLLVLYLLVYWGQTLFALLLAASVVLWAAGSSQATIVAGVAAIVVAAFNVGLALGEAGPPPGKRR